MNWKDPIEKAVRDATRRAPAPIRAEIIRKEWPADGIVYVHLTVDSGAEEWVLLETGSDYDKAYAMLLEPVRRLIGEDYSSCGAGDVCGVR